jgi:ParB family chromosome partitioning protein
MLTLHQKVLRDELSVRQTEALVKKYSESLKKKIKIIKPSSKKTDIIYVENKLIELFGTKVSIKKTLKGKGKIQIDFYSDSDLQRILDLISNYKKKHK